MFIVYYKMAFKMGQLFFLLGHNLRCSGYYYYLFTNIVKKKIIYLLMITSIVNLQLSQVRFEFYDFYLLNFFFLTDSNF
jgi:hypothetical protein